jgi:hypothetical protein
MKKLYPSLKALNDWFLKYDEDIIFLKNRRVKLEKILKNIKDATNR